MTQPTSAFQDFIDYKEAKSTPTVCYFGSSSYLPLSDYKKDVLTYKSTSKYYNRILCPEARGEVWSYEINQAFWAGLIDCGRPLLLVTDINHYCGPKNTVNEILWLKDNGYIFLPHPTNFTTWVIPPQNFNLKREIKNYYHAGKCTDSSASEIKQILSKLKKDLTNSRKDLLSVSQSLLKFGIQLNNKEICQAALEGFLSQQKISSKNYIIYCHTGDTYWALGDKVNAKKQYLKAFHFSKSNTKKSTKVLEDISKGLMRTASFAHAIECLNLIFELEPNNVSTKYLLGNAYLESGNKDNAKSAYQEAFNLSKTSYSPSVKLLENLSVGLINTTSFDYALECLNLIFKLEPNNIFAKYLLGNTYWELGDKDKAKNAYQEAFSLSKTSHPPSVKLLDCINIGLMKTASHTESCECLILISSLEPNNDLFKFLLGNTYFALGDKVNAKKAYLDAFKLSNIMTEKNLKKIESLGNALFKVKIYREALTCFELAIQLAPNNSKYLEIKSEIILELSKEEKVAKAATENNDSENNEGNHKLSKG